MTEQPTGWRIVVLAVVPLFVVLMLGFVPIHLIHVFSEGM